MLCSGMSPVTLPTSRSRAARLGRNVNTVSSQPGNSSGGRNCPPPKAMGSSATFATA